MKILGPKDRVIPHSKRSKRSKRHWSWTSKHIELAIKGDRPPPERGLFKIAFDKANQREKRLNYAWSGAENVEEFTRAQLQWGSTTHKGLLLPAPSHASFMIRVPAAAELTLDAGILPPEIRNATVSDGAELTISIRAKQRDEVIATHPLSTKGLRPIRVNLSRWSGEKIELVFKTTPAGDPHLDYCFLADPIISSRQANPKRVVLIFVDTLRPDHMGVYGYERQTTPFLDSWAKGGTTFTEARTIAPWTLPSYRSMLTGRYPNRWNSTLPIQEQLQSRGWSTAFFAGNVYLSSNFEGARGWGIHYAHLDSNATEQVNRATRWLENQDGRNTFIMLHLMDPHLPYREPTAYRRLFAGAAPKGLPKRFTRRSVLQASGLDKSAHQYIRDRYDNNLKFVDDELKRFYSNLRDDDLVIFVSDHGEEFWEHGAFEHGHQFWEEIVRIPFVARGPGIRVQRVKENITLLDLAPTVLDFAGVPYGDLDGQSLWPLLRNEKGWDPKTTGIGHPLYGGERWGAVDGHQKYIHYNGKDSLFDLKKDPKEVRNLLAKYGRADNEWHRKTGLAFGQDFPMAIRFKNKGSMRHKGEILELKLDVPGGIQNLWIGEDPLQSSSAHLDLNGPLLQWPGGYRGSRDIYVVPNDPIEQILASIKVLGRIGDRPWEPITPQLTLTNKSSKIAVHGFDGGGAIEISLSRSPVPTETTNSLIGHDDEMQEMLKALGYVTGNPLP